MENTWAAACNTHVSGSQRLTVMWALRLSGLGPQASPFSLPAALASAASQSPLDRAEGRTQREGQEL